MGASQSTPAAQPLPKLPKMEAEACPLRTSRENPPQLTNWSIMTNAIIASAQAAAPDAAASKPKVRFDSPSETTSPIEPTEHN